MVRKTRMRSKKSSRRIKKKIIGGAATLRLGDRLMYWTHNGIRYGKIVIIEPNVRILVEYKSQTRQGQIMRMSIVWDRLQDAYEVIKMTPQQTDRYSRFLRIMGDISAQTWWTRGINDSRSAPEHVSDSDDSVLAASPKTPKRKKNKRRKKAVKSKRIRKQKQKKLSGGYYNWYTPQMHDRVMYWTPNGIRYGKVVIIQPDVRIVVEYKSRTQARINRMNIAWDRLQNEYLVIKMTPPEIDRYSLFLLRQGESPIKAWWVEGIRAAAERLSDSVGDSGSLHSPKTPKRKKRKRKKRKKSMTKRKK
jgi:hypothetical protein